jgi:hypothetical protein
LPDLLVQHDPFVSYSNGQLFTGDLNKILINLEGEGEEPVPAAGENEEG